MATEEIVTRFTADLSDLEAKVKQATGTLGNYEQAADEAAGSIGKTTQAVGNLEAKTRTLVATEQAFSKAAKDAATNAAAVGTQGVPAAQKLTTATQQAAAATAKLATNQKQVAQGTKQVGQEGQKLGLFARLTQGISQGFSRMSGSVRSFAQGAKQGFGDATKNLSGLGGITKQIGEGLSSANIQTGNFGGALRLLANPIGLVTAAVGGFLLNLTRLDTVSDSLDKLKSGFNSFLDSLAGNATLGQTIEGIEKAVELAERLDRVNDKAVFNSIKTTKLRSDAAILERQARNRTLSEQERINLLEQANGLLEQAANVELDENVERAKIAYKDLVRSVEQQNPRLSDDFRKSLNGYNTLTQNVAANIRALQAAGFDVDPELFKKAADLQNQIVTGETEITLQKERNENRIDALKQTFADERAAKEAKEEEERRKRREKAAAEQAKRDAEESRRIQELGQLRGETDRQSIERTREAQRRATFEQGAPTLQTQILDIKFEEEDALNEIEKNFQRQKELAKGNADELTRIEIEKQALIIQTQEAARTKINDATDEFNKGQEQKAKDARDRALTILKTDEERQVEAKQKEYDQLIKDLEEFIKDEDELNVLRKALIEQRDNEILNIRRNNVTEQEKIQQDITDIGAGALQELIASFPQQQSALQDQVASINEQYNAQLQDLRTFAGTEQEIQAERARILEERNAALNAAEKQAGRERVKILLTALQKVLNVLITEVLLKETAKGAAKGGVAGAIGGAAQGAIIAAILNGLFSALISSIGGAYKGEEYIEGKPDIPNVSRDGYLRRVHKGERIMTAKANAEHWDVLDAIHKGKFNDWKAANLGYPMADYNVIPSINAYLDGDTGQRMASSIMLAKYYDKNIVQAIGGNRREQRRTNELLEVLAAQRNERRSGRYW